MSGPAETIDQIAVRLVAESMERHAAARRPPEPTEAEQRAARELREEIRDTALAHGVRPQAIRHVEREALALFERGPDGTLIGKGGASVRGNPLKALSLKAYLLQLSEDEAYLFTEAQGRQ